MYELNLRDNIITICFEEFEDLFNSSEVFYKAGFNVFPFFLNKDKILNTPYIPHYHNGIEEKRPHLHLIYENKDQLLKVKKLL